ncbi:protein TBATA [Aplysia californica]|uniref:Protein TBATA n=1 Tax=Aplysia californica TaxID=6500 RepID=A0ABM1AAW3_APLCA|nr:protein TBATA [Aplysia californica]
MATASEVFRPSDGELLIRDSLSQGPSVPTDTFKKEDRRPMTQGGYRFGQLSHNSFFTRHNPHPARVRHLKGLLDVPICSVNDDGYFANPRYSLQFPPNQHNTNRLKNWKGRIPVNAINVNSQLHPINTITGLQYFMGLNSYPYREKAIPKVGLVPVTEAWRDELSAFTQKLNLDNEVPAPASASGPKPEEEQRPRSTMYSPETGRLIPPPSRAMSRGGSRRGRYNGQQFVGGSLQHIAADPDLENVVLVMLCQILQTEDVNAVQAWLCSAGEREKEHVMGLVRSAIAGREEYYKQYPAEFIPDNGKAKLPPISQKPGSASGETNRLVLDEGNNGAGEPDNNGRWQKMWVPPVVPIEENAAAEEGGEQQEKTVVDDSNVFTVTPPVNDVFKAMPPTTRKPMTPLQPARVPTFTRPEPPATPKPASPEATKLKYTKSPPAKEQPLENMWSQKQSLNTF